MAPPLILDIDGTLTNEAGVFDPSLFEPIQAWPSPVILATGKAFPYPVALCHYMGIPTRVVAENGGVVCVDSTLELQGDVSRLQAAVEHLEADGIDAGWGMPDLVNRWRETEHAFARTQSLSRLESVADRYELEVIDSQYAYHLKDPRVSKGAGAKRAAAIIGFDLADAVAIGDSNNDLTLFEAVGHAIAVANANDRVKAVADEVLEHEYSVGTKHALDRLARESSEKG